MKAQPVLKVAPAAIAVSQALPASAQNAAAADPESIGLQDIVVTFAGSRTRCAQAPLRRIFADPGAITDLALARA